MEDSGILFSWNGVPCQCRCDHCLLASGTQPCRVPYADTQGIVERFLQWRNDSGKTRPAIEFAAGFCVDFPQLQDYVRFRLQTGMQGADSLQVGGIRKRSGDELRDFLGSLARAGVRRLGLSFHGTGASHDACTRRPGDFEFLLELAQSATECGMKRFETVLLRRSTIKELPALLAVLDGIPGLENRHIGPVDYRGRAKLLEADRPTAADLEAITTDVHRGISRQSLRTEAEWSREIELQGMPNRTRRYYLIPVSDEMAPQLRTTQPEDLLAEMREADRRLADLVPPMRELARRYADAQGERLYALRDLEWKWTDAFLDEHPDIDRTGAFDDQKPCILYK